MTGGPGSGTQPSLVTVGTGPHGCLQRTQTPEVPLWAQDRGLADTSSEGSQAMGWADTAM